MGMAKSWTEGDLMVAMNLYCTIPFGQFSRTTKRIIEVAARMGRTPSSLSMKLCNLASLDSYHRDRGISGLRGASRLDREIWGKFQQDWSGMAEKSETALEKLMQSAPTNVQAHDFIVPKGPSESERTIQVRRLQSFFRKTILANYECQCAISGISIPSLLIASHIIPWSQDEGRRADPTNGLCLNALYDRAFDSHLISFDENYRLMVSNELKKRDIPEFQQISFLAIEGQHLRLPHRFLPDQNALQLHREKFRAG
jgi:putative restriction endonuclease